MTRKPHLVFIVTVPVTARVLLRGQLAHLREHGFEVTVISSPGADLDVVARQEDVRVIEIPIAREIDPRADAISLARLTWTLRSLAPDLVNASTAKAGFLGMLAARAARVPRRVYLLRGLRLETETGIKRAVLGGTERMASACAHRVICVSESLRARYVDAGFAPDSKCVVLGPGSSNGVELERFVRTHELEVRAAALRQQLAIPPDSFVIGFVGRPVADKGIVELLDAFDMIREHRAATLLVVGAGFADDTLDPKIARHASSCPGVVSVGRVDEPAPYYALMDVLAFPSHREGFPNAPLEAAAAGVPTVGARATGVVDAIVPDKTGLLCDIGDARGLAHGLEVYARDPKLRRDHGERAAARAADFARERVWNRWLAEYERLLR